MNATFIVEGSVATKDDALHVSARVIDAARDRKIWVKDFDAATSDLRAVQRQIAKDIAAAIEKRGSPGT